MTTTTGRERTPAAAGPLAQSQNLTVTDWKTTIALGIFAIIAIVLFIGFGRDGDSTFSFTSNQTDVIALPTLAIPARGFGIFVAVVAVLMAAGSALLTRTRRKTPMWYIAIYALLLLIALLAWATVGNTLPVTGLLAGSLALSVPLIFGAMGGVLSERGGVVNIAIEGQLLAGAFVSAVVASTTHSVIAGLLAAMVAGTLVSFILAAFSIKYFVDQVIVGVVLNVLVLGLTNFLYTSILANDAATLNSPAQLPTLAIPGLSAIPVLGPVLFNQTIIVYLMYIAVAVVSYGLFFTRWGLRLRSVGEHPQAADTVGINVNSTRFWNVSLGGAIVGLGGAYFTLGSVGAFTEDVTSGAGYIALAAVIFGRWNPIRATLAALLFGFANNLQSVLGILGSPIPSDFLLMLPYLVTIIAVAGLIGQSRAPGADGKPYIKS
ncbi:ABC transporter permease [Glaciibacter psychrotolerans]|uniref:Simple sugar transport system permease protein n=1 Tax=Glaciibacter psychrotolerans TaxID=670054 RepID=A0A7Z0EDX2_9MICO|nr:ABC transporter permease [Leifsonia psychrotolerans]NYJ19884.1 simple sugar transport system permease protein [Leifsonia psychrotolerans]